MQRSYLIRNPIQLVGHTGILLLKIIIAIFLPLLLICSVIIFSQCLFKDFFEIVFKSVVKSAGRKPIIYWPQSSIFNSNSYWFVKTGKIGCPVNAHIAVACVVAPFWEDHPKNVDACVFYGPFLHKFPKYRNPDVLWGLIYEESPRVNIIFYDEKRLNLFNYSSTFSRFSDVPVPLQGLTYSSRIYRSKKYVHKTIISNKFYKKTSIKNSYLNQFAPVLYLQSNSKTFVQRDDYVFKLMKYIDIDCLGDCLNNKKLPQEITEPYGRRYYKSETYDPIFLNFTARYKFHLAIESGVCNDYVTEKLWRPIIQGVVPIYFGSPTVRDWLPNNKSAILIEDFASPELLARHLHELLLNDTKYEEYLEHKTKGLISNQKLISELKTRPYEFNMPASVDEFNCFLCKKLHGVNCSKTSVVTRKALDCQMPSSLLTGKPDLNLTQTIKDVIAHNNRHHIVL